MMWSRLLLLFLLAHIELVNLQGTHRLTLKGGDSPCHGYVEILHNKKPGYIGDKFWSGNTEAVVCKSTHCGKPVEQTTENMCRLMNKTVWLNELQCKGNESSLDQCLNPGWGISHYQKPTVKKIKCSREINITLVGYRCAGVVQYKADEETGYFCHENWAKDQADLVCQSLGCGAAEKIPDENWRDYKEMTNYMKTDCSNISQPNHVWQCVTGKAPTCRYPASVICKKFKRLQLRGNQSNVCSGRLEEWEKNDWTPVKISSHSDMNCRQMDCGSASSGHNVNFNGSAIQLHCSDEVKVVLRDKGKDSRCYGTVYIQKNNKLQPVCASSTWGRKEAEMVCRELNCGSVVQFTSVGATSGQTVIMGDVNCSGKESSLWHCPANRAKTLQCQKYPYLICSDSVNAKLVDGPGRCAGRLEIMHEGQWKRVHGDKWDDKISNIICSQLKCGNARTENPEKFMAGSGDFLTVTCSSVQKSNISECQIDKLQSSIQRDNKRAVGITCEEHKVVFLNGSCSGIVGIEEGGETYWLSGSNETWNKNTADTVCQQMHCGEAKNHTFIPSGGMMVWDKSYNCSSSGNDLFECDNATLPFDYNTTIAHVICTEKIEMSLTKGCYGHVNFSVQGESGGVCSDAWTDKKSKMVCEQLKCGEQVLSPLFKVDNYRILLKSVHTVQKINTLTQSNLVKMGDSRTSCEPAYVVCSASVKTRLTDSRDKCSGNVEIQYQGSWVPVCADDNTQNTICKELGCGKRNKTLDYFGPIPLSSVTVQCPQGAGSLNACTVSEKSPYCDLIGLRCSDWRTIALESDNTCSGEVIVYSEGKRHPVSSDGWTASEAQQLCKDMNCGKFKSLNVLKPPMKNEICSLWPKNFSCADVQHESIWDCEKNTPPAHNKKLYVECDYKPKITLSEGCSGVLKIDNIPVCNENGKQWKHEDSHKLCQELNCGNAIDESLEQKATQQSYHVQCDDHHYRLGQCKRVIGNYNSALVSIYCYHSLKFKTTKTCGGELQVLYHNVWKNVSEQSSIGDNFKEKLCQSINCSGVDPDMKPNRNKQVFLDFDLKCRDEVKDVRYCVEKRKQPVQSFPAELYCQGYVPDIVKPPVPPPKNLVSIIIGVGLLLVLVALIIVFVRFFLRKGKKSSRMLPGKDVFEEFESGDYEAVENNEIPSTFRSEADFISENDAPSASSLPYDDIDEATEAQPLNPPGVMAAASRDSYMNDDGLDENADGVTYEGEDPQENYDDIEAGPVTTQTKAEVHDSPSITPKGDSAAAPPDLVQGDDDYLVPGEDG
ncbi:scavenger receptor cysteine-rich type 1 protein M160 [Parambassis ranga]|uniref:Scavenger receptor cysteine-rich type 1 protein M160 n=1 Tax=Parambassis ranga TaxID=210632 RepID=A0A6P7IC92_9TELE|nr:scavenger receptor cysteine-rich type 1 protein M160-like [Parambassis ranga]